MPRPCPQPCPLTTRTDGAGVVVETVVAVAVETDVLPPAASPGAAARIEDASPPRSNTPARASRRPKRPTPGTVAEGPTTSREALPNVSIAPRAARRRP